MAVTGNSTTESTGSTTDTSQDCVVSLLQHAARTIDSMWRAAQMDGEHSTAVALGEASYGVHRALIALQSTDIEVDAALLRND